MLDSRDRRSPASGWFGRGTEGFRRLFEIWGEPEPATVARIPLTRAVTAPLRSLVDTDRVRRVLRTDPRPRRLVDPRTLQASQYGVTRSGLDYYLHQLRYPRTGWTWADQSSALNREVVVWAAAAGGPLLLSGHHRTTAALLRGEGVEVVWVEPDPAGGTVPADSVPVDSVPAGGGSGPGAEAAGGIRIAPLLWVGDCPFPHRRAAAGGEAVGFVSEGIRSVVADQRTARSVIGSFCDDTAWIDLICPSGAATGAGGIRAGSAGSPRGPSSWRKRE